MRRHVAIASVALLLMATPAAQHPPAASADATTVLRGHVSGVAVVVFSPDGRWLASGGVDGQVRLRDRDRGHAARVLRPHAADVQALAFSSDSRVLASAGYDRTVVLFDALSGRRVRRVPLPSWATALEFLPDGRLAAGMQNGDVIVLSPQGAVTLTIATGYPVNALTFTRDHATLITGGPLTVWDATTGEQRMRPQVPGGIGSVALCGEHTVVVAHRRGIATLTDLGDAGTPRRLSADTTQRVDGVGGGAERSVRLPVVVARCMSTGDRVISAGADTVIRIWDVATQAVVRVLQGHTMSVVDLAIAPDGKALASASLDGTVRVWRLE